MRVEAILRGIFDCDVHIISEPGQTIHANIGVGVADEKQHLGALLTVTDGIIAITGKHHQLVRVPSSSGLTFKKEPIEDLDNYVAYVPENPDFSGSAHVRIYDRGGILEVRRKR